MPEVQSGDDLTALALEALARASLQLQDGDVLVVTSKIVSKAEGRVVDLADIEPTRRAHELAEVTRKDPRLVELVLRESTEVSRGAPGVLVVQHRLGFVCANAGIDQSNLENGDNRALLLPLDPDATAAKVHDSLHKATGAAVGVVISDSQGRPFRMGNTGVAIGVAGMPGLLDLRGQPDRFGRKLAITLQGYADQVASMAQLVSGEGDEGRPLVLVRGLTFTRTDGTAQELVRPKESDLYR